MTGNEHSSTNEEGIQQQLQELYTKRDEYNKKIDRLKKEEEEDTYNLRQRLSTLMELKENVPPQERELHQLMDINIELMQSTLRRKEVFSDEIKERSTREKKQWSVEEENLEHDLQRLQMREG